MQSVRKTQRKGSRSAQNIKRFKHTEQKMTLFVCLFERFMTFKQTNKQRDWQSQRSKGIMNIFIM